MASRRSAPAAVSSTRHLLREAEAITGGAVALFLLLSLVSYQPDVARENLGGAVGHLLADVSLRALGLAVDLQQHGKAEDDETEQHREPGGEYAEHSGRTVAVAEVAALRCAAAYQQHRRDRERGGHADDAGRPDEVHELIDRMGSPRVQGVPAPTLPLLGSQCHVRASRRGVAAGGAFPAPGRRGITRIGRDRD